MSEIDDLLNKESDKDILDATIDDIDNIEALIIGYTRKNGSLHWRSNCRRSEGLGLVEVMKFDLLHPNEGDF